jgi:hypothetical protein
MSKDVDGVIAALRIVLREAESRSNTAWWKTAVLNRWINRLPGAWAGRWRELKLQGDSAGVVTRSDLISHLRATLAYLEVNRDHIKRSRVWYWPFRRGKPAPELIEAEFQDVADATEKPLKKTGKAVVLIGGEQEVVVVCGLMRHCH